MNSISKSLIFVALAGAGYFAYANYTDRLGDDPALDLPLSDIYANWALSNIDLDRAVGITVDTFARVEKTIEGRPRTANSAVEVLSLLSSELAIALNAVSPPLYEGPIGVSPLANSSLLAFEDRDRNGTRDKYNEDALFLIEIDGENHRIAATGRLGVVSEREIAATRIFKRFLSRNMSDRHNPSIPAIEAPNKGQ
jgi:hypothetical protein